MNRRLIQLAFAAALLVVVVQTSADVPMQPKEPTTQELGSPRPGELENKQVSTGSDDDNGAPDNWLQTLAALGIVIALIFLTRWVLRRISGVRRLGEAGNVLQVLATVSLSPRQQMFLVRMGGRVVLLGSGPGGLARLAEVTDPDEVAQLLETASENGKTLIKPFDKTQPAKTATTSGPQGSTDS